MLSRITHRGPDFTDKKKIFISDNTKAYFYGSVLWMQGPSITPQPLENNTGILLFNGDIFDETWTTEVSDTQTLMNKLCEKNDEVI